MARNYAPAEIENPIAYNDAIEARIKANAYKTRAAKWQAATPDHVELTDAMRTHRSAFVGKMYDSLVEWGSLTSGQEAAVRRIVNEDAAKKAERIAARAAADAASVHVGTVGERLTLALTISFATSFETQFGTMHVVGMKDAQGNIFIYKGNKFLGERGAPLEGKATVKEHGVREGVNQTILARPTLARPAALVAAEKAAEEARVAAILAADAVAREAYLDLRSNGRVPTDEEVEAEQLRRLAVRAAIYGEG
jgi:hypothetical protein